MLKSLWAYVVFSAVATAQIPVTPPAAHGPKAQPGPAADLCPLTIYIDAQGRLYDDRFNGRYRVSEQTLRSDVGGGCKDRGPTSSVRIQPAPKAKIGRLKDVLDLVKSVRPDVPVTTVTPPH